MPVVRIPDKQMVVRFPDEMDPAEIERQILSTVYGQAPEAAPEIPEPGPSFEGFRAPASMDSGEFAIQRPGEEESPGWRKLGETLAMGADKVLDGVKWFMSFPHEVTEKDIPDPVEREKINKAIREFHGTDLTPEEKEARFVAQVGPTFYAIRRTIADFLPQKIIPGMQWLVSPTEWEEYKKKATADQQFEILGETAMWMVAPPAIKGSGALVNTALRKLPGLRAIPWDKPLGKFLTESNWFRMLTNKERGLVVQTVEQMKKNGWSDADILKGLRSNPKEFNRFYQEQAKARGAESLKTEETPIKPERTGERGTGRKTAETAPEEPIVQAGEMKPAPDVTLRESPRSPEQLAGAGSGARDRRIATSAKPAQPAETGQDWVERGPDDETATYIDYYTGDDTSKATIVRFGHHPGQRGPITYNASIDRWTDGKWDPVDIRNPADTKTGGFGDWDDLAAAKKAVEQYVETGELPKAAPAEAKSKPKPRKAAAPRPSQVRTLRGAIKKMGGINPGKFRGEFKESPVAVKFLLKKTGVPIDVAEMNLRSEGWLHENESLLELIRMDAEVLKRRSLEKIGDFAEKKEAELTDQERRLKTEMEHEPETPPPGEYVEMKAADLPEGRTMTIIEGNTADGWDTYKVVEKDPFGITLEDGETIELRPDDRIEVLKDDLPKGPTKVTDPERVQGIKNAILEGELILRTGKFQGRKRTKEQLEAVRRQVERDKAKIRDTSPIKAKDPVAAPPDAVRYIDKNGGIVRVSKGSHAEWTFYRIPALKKDQPFSLRNYDMRRQGQRVKVRTIEPFYKTREEAQVALDAYAASQKWKPVEPVATEPPPAARSKPATPPQQGTLVDVKPKIFDTQPKVEPEPEGPVEEEKLRALSKIRRKASSELTQNKMFEPNQQDMFGQSTSGELKDMGGYADSGGYASNIQSIIELPEIVQLAKELLQGRYPKIMSYLRGGRAAGTFSPVGQGNIKLAASIFTDEAEAAPVLAHEIGHLVDYLPDRDIKRGNILGRIASLKRYMNTLATMPGGPGELTPKDRNRLRYQAKKMVEAEGGAERWVDDFIRRELPIKPEDVLNIWNAVENAKMINPGLYDYVATLNTPEKKAIVRDAMKGVVRADLRQFAKVIEEKTGHKIKVTLSEEDLRKLINQRYADLINEEIEKRKLFNQVDITQELKTLTRQWKPFNPEANPKYTKYRYSSVELYADAFSALINAPGMLKQMAPTFYEAFFNYLERKPEVKALYNQIQDDIRTGQVERDRTRRAYQMFRSGDDAYALSLSRKNRFGEGLMRELVDAHWTLIKKIRQVKEANIPAGDNPRYKIEEMTYSGSEVEWYLKNVKGEIIRPLENASLSWDDFGFELFMKRIAGERAEMANPQGWTPRLARRKLAELREQRTDTQNQAIDAAQAGFNKLREYTIEKGAAAGRWPADLVELMRDTREYATFDVIDYIEKRYGAGPSAKIYRQIGTLNEIANPATATVLKDIAIVKAINRQIAAESVVKFMQKHYPKEIRPADRKWNGKFREIREPKPPTDLGLIAYLKDGQAHGYYVDKWIADIFDRNPLEAHPVARTLSATIQPFRLAFTELNFGFWMFNIHRDFFRAATNLPKANIRRFVPYYMKGIRPAFKSVYGITDETVDAMLRNNELISIGDVRGLRPEDKQIERMLAMYHMRRQTWDNAVLRPFGRFFTYYTNIGRAMERIPKVAGHKYLKEKFPQLPDETIGHIVRTQAGSPSFLTVGRFYPIYNNVLMFSNAMKEGYRGDYQAFSEDRAAFMWKKAKYVLIPKLLMYAGSLGILGAGVKEILDGASEYDKTNYLVIPLAMTDNGKSVYLRVPTDETGRFMGGILWKALQHDKREYTTGLIDYMAGQAPTVHPGVEAVIAAVEYASGRNPYDHFKGKYAIPEQIFLAGGARSHAAFAKWLANKSGMSLVYRFKYDDVDRIKTELEEILGYPLVSNLLGRFIKVTNQGVRERLRSKTLDVRQENTRELLDAKEVVNKLIRYDYETDEPFTDSEILLLASHPDVIDRNLAAGLARKYGHVHLEALITAPSTDERVVIWNDMLEHQRNRGK